MDVSGHGCCELVCHLLLLLFVEILTCTLPSHEGEILIKVCLKVWADLLIDSPARERNIKLFTSLLPCSGGTVNLKSKKRFLLAAKAEFPVTCECLKEKLGSVIQPQLRRRRFAHQHPPCPRTTWFINPGTIVVIIS